MGKAGKVIFLTGLILLLTGLACAAVNLVVMFSDGDTEGSPLNELKKLISVEDGSYLNDSISLSFDVYGQKRGSETGNGFNANQDGIVLKEFFFPRGDRDIGPAAVQTENLSAGPATDRNRNMPEVEIEGRTYIGILEIPQIDLELPVQSTLSMDILKISPCRYSGSVFRDDMVICGHNYKRHFRRLSELQCGDCVLFTDVEGNCYRYRVMEQQMLRPRQSYEMKNSKYDLTLFTCTKAGTGRVTIRCVREK